MTLLMRWLGAGSIVLLGIVAFADTTLVVAQIDGADQPDFLTESYRDWVVRCERASDSEGLPDRNCEMVQQLTRASDGQVLVQLRIGPPDENGVHSGMLTVPLAILVQHPLMLRVDGEDVLEARVSSCVQIGCIAPIAIEPGVLETLRSGESLTVRLATANTREIYEAALSLQGFSAASDRLAEFAGAPN